MTSYHIKNWEKFQHYKHRDPPWIRLYADLLNDVEWFELPAESAKALIGLWLIAREDDGQLPNVKRLAFRLRTTESKLEQQLKQLSHWVERDDSATLAPCAQHAAPETETETETEEKVFCAVAVATRTADGQKFEDFKRAYPKRKGANPWKPARDKWDAALKRGEDPDQIIAALKAGVGFDREKIGTEYMPTALVWLNQRRYADYQATAPPSAQQPPPGAPSHEELIRHYGKVGQIRNHAEPHQEPGNAEVLSRRNGLDPEGPGGEGVHHQTGNARIRRLA